jgi:mono/diheme cytochrome c family protein
MVLKRLVALAALGLLALGALAFLYREAIAHGFSAREEPWAIERFAARRLRSLATGIEAKQLRNPIAAMPHVLEQAREHFEDHCALCHGRNGSGETAINEGLYPPAPDLREAATQQLSDGELFAIIRNGIRFTGMPGWGGADSDEEIWELVLYLRALPHRSGEDEPEGSHGAQSHRAHPADSY